MDNFEALAIVFGVVMIFVGMILAAVFVQRDFIFNGTLVVLIFGGLGLFGNGGIAAVKN